MNPNKCAIALVGGGAVGKSALAIQYTRHQFCEDYDPTIEDQYRKQTVIDEECVILDIIDTAGQEEYAATSDLYIRTAQGFLIVFSLTSVKSFDEVEHIYERVLTTKDETKVPMILVGNKCDLVDDIRVEQGEIDHFCKRVGAKYIRTSAKNRINVDESFEELVREIRRDHTEKQSKEKKKVKNSKCPLL